MKRVYLILGLFFAFLSYIFLGFFAHFYNYSVDKISVRDISYKDKIVRIGFSNSYGNIYCAVVYGDKTNTIKWERVKDGNCNYKIKDFGNYNIYIKKNNSIRKVYGINKVLYVSIDKDKYYLAVNDSKKIVYTSISIGYDSLPVKSDDESIAYVKNGVINATKSGTTKIRVGDKEITVIVTDLIDKMPKKYNYKPGRFTWFYDIENVIPILNENNRLKVGKTWVFILKYILPVFLLFLWINGVYHLALNSNNFEITIYILITVLILIVSYIFTNINKNHD